MIENVKTQNKTKNPGDKLNLSEVKGFQAFSGVEEHIILKIYPIPYWIVDLTLF